jgi:hypothetical protein
MEVRKAFFFEKKKQKTFANRAERFPGRLSPDSQFLQIIAA